MLTWIYFFISKFFINFINFGDRPKAGASEIEPRPTSLALVEAQPCNFWRDCLASGWTRFNLTITGRGRPSQSLERSHPRPRLARLDLSVAAWGQPRQPWARSTYHLCCPRLASSSLAKYSKSEPPLATSEVDLAQWRGGQASWSPAIAKASNRREEEEKEEKSKEKRKKL